MARLTEMKGGEFEETEKTENKEAEIHEPNRAKGLSLHPHESAIFISTSATRRNPRRAR
jgi:hypothetical protein